MLVQTSKFQMKYAIIVVGCDFKLFCCFRQKCGTVTWFTSNFDVSTNIGDWYIHKNECYAMLSCHFCLDVIFCQD